MNLEKATNVWRSGKAKQEGQPKPSDDHQRKIGVKQSPKARLKTHPVSKSRFVVSEQMVPALSVTVFENVRDDAGE
jgi:hypothetical protein